MRFLPRTFLARRLALLITFTLSTLLAWAADPLRAFDVPAGEAAVTLKQAAKQGQVEIVFPAQLVQGITTNAVKGDFTARAALNRMLAGTELVLVTDEKTGALTVNRVPRDEKNAPSRPADATAAKITDGTVHLDKFEVNERRIDGLNNKGLLQGGANAPLYHDVVTRLEIERMGVTSVEELFRLIPQTSSPMTGLQTLASAPSISGGGAARISTTGLRGFDSAQTVILVNGRALPRSGTTNSGGPDLSRIPLAAIERVEILPYAGSAIYGAGAIGGAINIILRREYAGKEITTYLGTSTEGGATEYRFTYLDGRTFNGGKTNLTTTFSYQHRDALLANQRDYLAEALRRYGPNTTVRNAQGLSAFESFIVPAFAGSPATILISPNDPNPDLGIPGAPGVRFATVPAGTSPAQSFGLTPVSFTSTVGSVNASARYGRSILYLPIDAYSLNGQLEHEFIKDRLSAYGEFTVGYNRRRTTYPQFAALDLAANDPLNPFRTDVTPGFVGRAVRVYFDTPDLSDNDALSEYESARAVVGFKGHFSERWEWSVDGTIDYVHNTQNTLITSTNVVALNNLNAPSGVPAATRRLIYPLLADHRQYPVSAADADAYFPYRSYSASHGVLKEGNARVTGDVFDLPAGPVRTSIVGKYQKWKFVNGASATGRDEFSQLYDGVPFAQSSGAGPNSARSLRAIQQGAFELSIPVIGKTWRPIPIESFEIQGSASVETDESSGVNPSTQLPFTNKKDARSNVIAGKLQLTQDVAFRVSYSEGFYPPNWTDVSDPVSVFQIPGIIADPKRGNTMQFVPFYNITNGGNPDLKPETAKSENYGVIFTPRFAPGLTLSLDYWKITKVDAIVRIFLFDSVANPDLYGFLLTRAAPTAQDQANGWLGVITDIDQRATNAAQVSTEGIDGRIRYSFDTASLGSFAFNTSVAFTNYYRIKASPTAPDVNTAGGSGPVRLRGNMAFTWTRQRWSTTLTGRYVGHYSTSSTAPSASYPTAFPYDGGRVPAYLHWDLQASYEVPASSGQTGWRQWFSATKFTLGALNILNEKPAFVTAVGATGAGTSFYNQYDDPRQRFVYLSIKKSF